MAHNQHENSKKHKSLIVCPASIVGHWIRDIEKIVFKQCGLNPLQYTGTKLVLETTQASKKRKLFFQCSRFLITLVQ